MPVAHPPEFRRRAVELVRLGGKPVTQIARDLGISYSCLRNWARQADIDEGTKQGMTYSILGPVIFAGLTMVDFQRLRRSTDLDSAPFVAASIFLDALNVFSFFLQLLGGRNRD